MAAKQPHLRSQDVAVALHLALFPSAGYETLAAGVGLSLSATHRAVRRLQEAGVVSPARRRVDRSALLEFLRHGVKYAFPAVRGPEVRGVPTAWSTPDLRGVLPAGADVVWPDAQGTVRGESVTPLYDGAPGVAHHNPRLYRALALVDALRVGQARERKAAIELLEKELGTQ